MDNKHVGLLVTGRDVAHMAIRIRESSLPDYWPFGFHRLTPFSSAEKPNRRMTRNLDGQCTLSIQIVMLRSRLRRDNGEILGVLFGDPPAQLRVVPGQEPELRDDLRHQVARCSRATPRRPSRRPSTFSALRTCVRAADGAGSRFHVRTMRTRLRRQKRPLIDTSNRPFPDTR
jgi:hypothetical protein